MKASILSFCFLLSTLKKYTLFISLLRNPINGTQTMFYLVFFSSSHLGFLRCFVIAYLLLIKTRVVLYFSPNITLRHANCCTARTRECWSIQTKIWICVLLCCQHKTARAPGTESSGFRFDMWLRCLPCALRQSPPIHFSKLMSIIVILSLSLVHHATPPTPDCVFTQSSTIRTCAFCEKPKRPALISAWNPLSSIVFFFVFIPVGKWLCRSLKGFHCSSSMCICVCLSVFFLLVNNDYLLAPFDRMTY